MAERFEILRRNKYYLFWCRFFVDLNALNAVVQLFYIARGVTLPQIFLLGIAWSVGTLMFDIPSSYLADRWGRKNTILTGVIINVLANGYLFFAHGFWPFFLDTFILAISYSFFFGVEDAFLYDTLREMKQEKVVLKTAGKYASAGRISRILTPLIGVLIAKDLSESQLNILLLINFLSSCLAVFFAIGLSEPKKFLEKYREELNVFKDGVKTFLTNEALRAFAFNKALIFIASFVFWRFYQKELFDLGFSVFLLGLIYPVSNAILVTVFVTAPKISEKLSYSFFLNFITWTTLISTVIFLLSYNKLILFFTSIILLTVATVRDPFFTQQIQWRLKSYNRATTSSILGIFKGASDIPVLLLSGYVATFGNRWVLTIVIGLSLVTLIFFRIKKKYILLAK